MFCPFNPCIKQPYVDLPLEAIFFVCELSLPKPIFFLIYHGERTFRSSRSSHDLGGDV